MPLDPSRPVCWLLPDIGHYHHARVQAAALSGNARTIILEFHGRSGFAEFAHTHRGEACYEVVRVEKSIPVSLDELRPSVVFINGWSGREALSGLRWCQHTRTPAVLMSDSTRFDSIGDDEPDPGQPVARRWWREVVKRRIVRQFSAALVGGAPHRDYAMDLGLLPDRIFDGYDAVDNDHFSIGADVARADAAVLRGRYGLPERYFLASGRFIPKKNFTRLLRAFAEYRNAVGADAWELVLLGDGPEQPVLLRLIDKLGIGDAIHLVGFKSFQELPMYYGLAGAFIHASTTEQWGLVVNEAMAAGLPVVVSQACGCVQDLVTDRVTGLMFDPYDVAELTYALTTVAAPGFDHAAMGRAARARMTEWSPTRFATNFWRAAETAVAVGPQPPTSISRALLATLSAWA